MLWDSKRVTQIVVTTFFRSSFGNWWIYGSMDSEVSDDEDDGNDESKHLWPCYVLARSLNTSAVIS